MGWKGCIAEEFLLLLSMVLTNSSRSRRCSCCLFDLGFSHSLEMFFLSFHTLCSGFMCIPVRYVVSCSSHLGFVLMSMIQ